MSRRGNPGQSPQRPTCQGGRTPRGGRLGLVFFSSTPSCIITLCLRSLADFGLGDIPGVGAAPSLTGWEPSGPGTHGGGSPSSNLCPGQRGPCRVRLGLAYCVPSRVPRSVLPAAPGAGLGDRGIIVSRLRVDTAIGFS